MKLKELVKLVDEDNGDIVDVINKSNGHIIGGYNLAPLRHCYDDCEIIAVTVTPDKKILVIVTE